MGRVCIEIDRVMEMVGTEAGGGAGGSERDRMREGY